MSKKLCMYPWPEGLKYNILRECTRTGNHKRHQTLNGKMQWWGVALSAPELELAAGLRQEHETAVYRSRAEIHNERAAGNA